MRNSLHMVSRAVIATASLTISFALGAATPAFGQDAGTSADPGFGEIVVTAKNREEKSQDVPLAITNFSAASIEQAQIRDVRDLQRLTPSLNISGARADPLASSLRGIAPNTADERFQGISFFIDGVAMSGQVSSFDPSQVERIEIIKGPQSASFGRATYTGAINYVTREPSGNSLDGRVSVRGGFNDGAPEANYAVNAYLSFPIVNDRLWASVEGSLSQQGGVVRSRDSRVPVGRERTQAAAGTLLWKPSDDFKIKLRAGYSHDRDTAALTVTQHARDWQAAGVNLVALSRGSGALWPTRVPSIGIDRISITDRNFDPWLPGGGLKRNRFYATAVVSKLFGDFELSYRGGYFADKRTSATPTFNRSATSDPVFAAPLASGQATLNPAVTGLRLVSFERFKNQSHQLLLLSPGDRRLRYRIGGYYFKEKDENYFSINKTAANPTGQLRGLEKIENKAIFGGLDFDLTDALTFSAEARYQWEKLKQDTCSYCGTINLVEANISQKNFLPRVTLSYKITPDNMVYALYSLGIKSGRLSQINSTEQFYALPEELDNFEIGSKNTFFNGRLLFNLSAFYMKLKNQQLVSTIPFTGANGQVVQLSTTNNVGGSEVKGFEAEFSFKATDNLTLSGGLGYAHQEFTSNRPLVLSAATAVVFPGAFGAPVSLKGKTQANVPSINGFVSGEYIQPDVFDRFSAGLRLDATYKGSYYVDLANISKVGSAWVFNGRLRLFSDDFEVALFGRNLLNDDRPVGVGLAGASSSCVYLEQNTAAYGPTNRQVCMSVYMPRPRELGVELIKRF